MNRRNFLRSSGATMLASLAAGRAAAASEAEPVRAPVSLAELLSLSDVEAAARRQLGEPLYDYLASGAADELTLRWNLEKYRELRLRPRALQDVSNLDATLELFGQRLAMPILLAPAMNPMRKL
jgi:4-hydroxymandelate oxidase